MNLIQFSNKKGAQGIGTLIIFIALILVAAVAAGVVIQTGNELQSKALAVGSQTQAQLVSFLRVNSIQASDASDGLIEAGVDNLTLVVKPGTQIQDIRLRDLVIQVFTQDGLQTLQFSGGNASSQTEYGVSYLSNLGNDTLTGYITSEDLAVITFSPEFNLTERKAISISLTPLEGQTTTVDFYTPGALTDTAVRLYP